MMSSCKTYPNLNDPEISQYLDIEYTPEFIAFNSSNPELKKILTMQLDFYSKYLIVLIQAKEIGAWRQPYLDEEIEICISYIDWLKNLMDGLKNKDNN